MTDIGILTCSNITQDVGCSSGGCFRAAHDGSGSFADYPDGVRVMGVINCAGCGGLHAHAKILRRVGALAATGVSAIHLSGCMVGGCPFVAKYEKAIKEAYPEISVVRGTHGPMPEAVAERLHAELAHWMTAPRKTVPEIVRDALTEAGMA